MEILDEIKKIKLEDFVKSVSPRGNGKSLKSNKPKNGIHAFVWRFARFHGGVDMTMPMTIYWDLVDEIEKQFGVKYRFSIMKKESEEKAICDYLDFVVDKVLITMKMNPFNATLRWKQSGLF